MQLPVSIAHDANGDLCEAYLTESYVFDLGPIKTLYRETYRRESGSIVLLLEDTEGVYEFDK